MNTNHNQNHNPTETHNQLDNLTPADFLIGTMGVFFLAMAVYLILCVMYPDLLPMPKYSTFHTTPLAEYKRELLNQSLMLSTFGTAFLSGLYGIQKVRLNRYDRNNIHW